jgi:hypothetical protein
MTRTRAGLVAFAVALALAVAAIAGPRAGLLVALGLGLGLTLEGLGFGFAGPWRTIVVSRDARGLVAQFVAIALAAAAAFPLLAAAPGELAGAWAPVGTGMILGAFVFGAAMQLAMGCGSGTLLNAGSGNLVGGIALVGFITGSFAATLHLDAWAALGQLPLVTLPGAFGTAGGLAVTLAGLATFALLALRRAEPGKRMPPARLWIAAALIAALVSIHLMVAGQPWGVVYGLGLWGAKIAQAAGMDVAASAFWSVEPNAGLLRGSILNDVTSLTNIGLIVGAYLVMRWKSPTPAQTGALRPASYAALLVVGLVLGYSSRIAFGCNVGAYFSGIVTGSLHGWIWLAAAFAGSIVGIRLRPIVLVPRIVPAGAPA